MDSICCVAPRKSVPEPVEGWSFRPAITVAGWALRWFLQQGRSLVADGLVRAILIVISEPSLHLFSRIRSVRNECVFKAFASENAR